MEVSTIAAIATPPGAGGIGVLKISGPDATRIAGAIFQHRSTASHRPPTDGHSTQVRDQVQTHRLYYGHIVNPDSGNLVDEVLMTVMKAPHSYTCEDVVEIQAHSGPATMRSILELILEQGARIANPGEFTKRAYMNGRIDLTQAEAVIDIINARTDTALRSAAGQMNGKLNAAIEDIKSVLTDLLVDIEAGIDFPEDVAEILPTTDVANRMRQSVNKPIEALIDKYRHHHVYRDGLRLVIIGKPNVGKSSLMNCLVRKERAIVTDLPGTTRDLVEEGLQIRGIPINIVDTAGLHDTEDPVERMGIHKARECIQGADLVIFLVDAAGELSADDHQIYNQYSGMNIILVLNKMDLVDNDVSSLKTPDQWNGIPRVAISALYEKGIDELEEQIVKSAVGENGSVPAYSMIPNLRHKQALEKCLDSIDRALAGINAAQPVELTAIDVKAAIAYLDDIVGTTPSPDILDQIFSSFCIGK